MRWYVHHHNHWTIRMGWGWEVRGWVVNGYIIAGLVWEGLGCVGYVYEIAVARVLGLL